MKHGKGWHGESRRHSMARRGIKTARMKVRGLFVPDPSIRSWGKFQVNPNDIDFSLFEKAEELLDQAGVYFDTGYDIPSNRYEWELDFSLRGGYMEDGKLHIPIVNPSQYVLLEQAEKLFDQAGVNFQRGDVGNEVVWDIGTATNSKFKKWNKQQIDRYIESHDDDDVKVSKVDPSREFSKEFQERWR